MLLGVITGYSRNILPPSHIKVGLTHSEAHSYVRGKEYTFGVPNKFHFIKHKHYIFFITDLPKIKITLQIINAINEIPLAHA